MVTNDASLFERRLLPPGHNPNNFTVPHGDMEIARFKAPPTLAALKRLDRVVGGELSADQVSIEARDNLREIVRPGLP